MTILITGVAGFIGYHIAQKFLNEGHVVVGIDNLNDYYDVQLKKDRLAQIKSDQFTFIKADIAELNQVTEVFDPHDFDIVVNLAAQAGVRYSIENPAEYTRTNLNGFANILEACRQNKVQHLVFASSSSIYGNNCTVPYQESAQVDQPISYYAATKKSNELMAHSYANIYGLKCTGLRFFTVYGPWGRPDMALMLFAKAISEDKAIKVFNQGKLSRDFTYIDDIVEGIYKSSISTNHLSQEIPYDIFNIANGKPVKLLDFIESLEKHIGKAAKKDFVPMQAGDVYETFADITKLSKTKGYKASTDLDSGVKKFVDWFKSYYSN
jgi:UDP-glucuronate 4-epimerase